MERQKQQGTACPPATDNSVQPSQSLGRRMTVDLNSLQTAQSFIVVLKCVFNDSQCAGMLLSAYVRTADSGVHALGPYLQDRAY